MRSACPASSAPPTAARRAREGCSEGSDLLAPGACERMTAYVLLTLAVLAGLAVKSRPFGRAVKAASATDTHRFLSLLALGAIALHAITLVLDQTVHIGLAALLIPGVAELSPRCDRARGPRSRTCRPDHRVVSAAKTHRRPRLASPALRDVRSLRCGDGARARGGNRYPSPWAFGLYLGAVFAVAVATAWRALNRPIPTKGVTRVPDRDRPLAV